MISTRILIMPFQYWLGFVGSKINCSRKLPSKFTVENVSLFSASVHSIFFSVFWRVVGAQNFFARFLFNYSHFIFSFSFHLFPSHDIFYIENEYFPLNFSQETISIRCYVRFQRGFWRITLLRWVFPSVFVYSRELLVSFFSLSKGG